MMGYFIGVYEPVIVKITYLVLKVVWDGALRAFPPMDGHPRNSDTLSHRFLTQSGSVTGPPETATQSRNANSHLKPRMVTCAYQLSQSLDLSPISVSVINLSKLHKLPTFVFVRCVLDYRTIAINFVLLWCMSETVILHGDLPHNFGCYVFDIWVSNLF